MVTLRSWSVPGLAAALLISSGISFEPDQGSTDGAAMLRVSSDAFAGPVQARVERVVDGDTFDVRARIWLGQSLVVRVRIAGIDAPELRSRCDAEHILAIEARDYLERRIAGGEVRLSEIAYDKYGGRVLASVGDSAGDIGAAMIAAGLARPYDGGTRTSWCAP